VEVEGVLLRLAEAEVWRYQLHGDVEVVVEGGRVEVRDLRERVEVGAEREQVVTWQVLDPTTRLGAFLSAPLGPKEEKALCVVAPTAIVEAAARDGRLRVRVTKLGRRLPTEEELLECSRFYTIFVPRAILETWGRGGRRALYYIDLYRRGRRVELTIPCLPGRWCVGRDYLFRIARSRLSLSTYAKRLLPSFPWRKVDPLLSLASLARVAEEWASDVLDKALPAVRQLPRSEPRRLDPLEELLDTYYLSTPKRKLQNVVEPWLRVFDAVKGLAPRASLYIVFRGKRYPPRLPGIRVDADGSVHPLFLPPLRTSAIVLKGGEFERAYVSAYVARLLEYQLAPVQWKLRMLYRDALEARAELERRGFPPSSSFGEYLRALKALALSAPGDNVLLLFLAKAEGMKRLSMESQVGVDDAAKLVAGFVKTGTEADAARLAEYGVLKLLRIAVKHEMKRRCYSPKLGVVFSGTPRQARLRILEALRGLRGRLLALAEVPEEVLEERVPLAASLARVEALLAQAEL